MLYTICSIGLIDSLITGLGFFALNGNLNKKRDL